jgi:chromosome segregation ATPase
MATQPVRQKQDTTKTKSVPVSQDLIYQAKQMFPGYEDSTAMALYVMDKAQKQQETDSLQNKLIQTQKSQNDKLTNAVKSLSQELHDFENQSLETDREVERLKDLTTRLRPAGEIQQQTAKASREELEKLEQKLNSLKSTPGIDQEKFVQLSKQVEQMKNMKSVDDGDVKKIEQILSSLQGKQGASDELFNKAMDRLNKTQQALDGKEERFKAYIAKKSGEVKGAQKTSAEELKKYADMVDKYKQDIENFKGSTQQDVKDFGKLKDQVANELYIIRNIRGGVQDAADKVQSDVEQANKLLQFIKQASGYADSQAATDNAISKAQTSAAQQGRNLTGIEVQESIKNTLKEDVRISRQWRDPEFTEWMQKNLPVLVKHFKNVYKLELLQKQRAYKIPYSDKQIAYNIENLAQWIDDWFRRNEDKPLTKDAVEIFLSAVRSDLFSEPPEPEQLDMPLGEGIGNIFENMINQLYKKSTKNL